MANKDEFKRFGKNDHYITIYWSAPVPMEQILDKAHYSMTDRVKFNAHSRVYYVTGFNSRTGAKRIYIGKAAETSVLGRMEDHQAKRDMLNNCVDKEVRIGRITNTGGLDVEKDNLNLVDQVESILIYEFKNYQTEIGDKMIDNDKKKDSYKKYHNIEGIYNHGDIDEMPEKLDTGGHNAIDE